jgi:hypothetical protein
MFSPIPNARPQPRIPRDDMANIVGARAQPWRFDSP